MCRNTQWTSQQSLFTSAQLSKEPRAEKTVFEQVNKQKEAETMKNEFPIAGL